MCGERFSSAPTFTGNPTAGDHDASRLTEAQKDAFINAYLNNRLVELERIRSVIAPASLARLTKLEAGNALAKYLIDEYPYEYLHENEDSSIDEDDTEKLVGLVNAWQRAV